MVEDHSFWCRRVFGFEISSAWSLLLLSKVFWEGSEFVSLQHARALAVMMMMMMMMMMIMMTMVVVVMFYRSLF